jgi:hypothetical protein
VNVLMRYLGKSGVAPGGGGVHMRFAPNLARPRTFFDAELRQPLRFREAVSALHDVVVGDLRFKKRDKTAYQAWRKQQDAADQKVRELVTSSARKAEVERLAKEPIPPNLEGDFRKMHGLYWTARRQWAAELSRNDPALFRSLVPCDPVVTVAPDVVFFECFSKDESSYGSLYVDREAFKGEGEAGLGTTNVDYSLALYEHFQTLRTYRATRLQVDPAGFDVQVEGAGDYREEKIDLPPSWLRGFSQLQAAMALPTRTVELSTDVIYSMLAYLRRHREKTGPRSLKFQLTPGQPPVVVLEPWGIPLVSRGAVYDGPKQEEIKVWGRRRLFALARLLPLTEKVTVQLVGPGMPSMWTAHLGEMRFLLALSGWTANDWTSGASLELLAGEFKVVPATVAAVTRELETARSVSLATLSRSVGAPRDHLLGALHLLSKQGQVVYDFATGLYRYRQVMPVALSETVLGPEPPEVVAGRAMYSNRQVRVVSRQEFTDDRRVIYVAKAGNVDCEAMISADGVMSKAVCSCSFFRQSRLRSGPCRHLLALRLHVQNPREVLN